MSKAHNKKRNVGIIYELLLRHVSHCLIEGKNKEAQKALDILQKRFSQETELYKEFRLFNALVKSTVTNTSIAAAILTEAKSAARRTDRQKLDREKSFLIKEINYSLNDSSFYKRRIPDYKTYASIQVLLNNWRKKDESDLTQMVMYESKVIDHLLSEKKDESDLEKHIDPDVNSLVIKILTEKFNKKYGEKLNEEQKELIKFYVFSLEDNTQENISRFLFELKSKTLEKITRFKDTTDNDVILEKIDDVSNKINNLPVEEINDQSISKYLTVSRLSYELVGDLQ